MPRTAMIRLTDPLDVDDKTTWSFLEKIVGYLKRDNRNYKIKDINYGGRACVVLMVEPASNMKYRRHRKQPEVNKYCVICGHEIENNIFNNKTCGSRSCRREITSRNAKKRRKPNEGRYFQKTG